MRVRYLGVRVEEEDFVLMFQASRRLEARFRVQDANPKPPNPARP